MMMSSVVYAMYNMLTCVATGSNFTAITNRAGHSRHSLCIFSPLEIYEGGKEYANELVKQKPLKSEKKNNKLREF